MLIRIARARLHLDVFAIQSLPLESVPARRSLSTSKVLQNVKPSMANIAQIRKSLPGTTLIKAKEALTATSDDLNSAITWLEKDSAISGAKKASKVQGRQAKEGGVGITIIVDGGPAIASPTIGKGLSITTPAKAGIVELNCETDFVGRNEIFQSLLADLSHTIALFPTLALDNANAVATYKTQEIVDLPVKGLLDFPLLPRDPIQQEGGSSLPRTIGAAILDVISRLGENISISRASALSNAVVPDLSAPRRSDSISHPPWRIASAFTHGGIAPVQSANSNKSLAFCSSGRVGSLLLSRFEQPKSIDRSSEASLAALRGMAKSLARQAAGMPTERIQGRIDDEMSLYNQSFIMRLKSADLQGEDESTGDDTVQNVLSKWSKAWTGDEESTEAVSVIQLRRWELGEESSVKIE